MRSRAFEWRGCHYDTLEISRKASDTVIRASYKALCQKHHPDKHPDEDATAANRDMACLNEAYAVLSDPLRRAAYDQALDELSAAASPKPAASAQAQRSPAARAAAPQPVASPAARTVRRPARPEPPPSARTLGAFLGLCLVGAWILATRVAATRGMAELSWAELLIEPAFWGIWMGNALGLSFAGFSIAWQFFGRPSRAAAALSFVLAGALFAVMFASSQIHAQDAAQASALAAALDMARELRPAAQPVVQPVLQAVQQPVGVVQPARRPIAAPPTDAQRQREYEQAVRRVREELPALKPVPWPAAPQPEPRPTIQSVAPEAIAEAIPAIPAPEPIEAKDASSRCWTKWGRPAADCGADRP